MNKLENWQKSDKYLPFKDGEWVKIIAHIRNNKTGEIRDYLTETVFFKDDDQYPHIFIWEDGNYGCDCNRSLFFEYAADETLTYDDIPDRECGHGDFSINLENPLTNEIYYREFVLDSH